VIVGLAVSLGIGRFLSTFLYGVAPGDPKTFAVVIPILIVVASIPMVLPARGASRVDPVIALRSE
jgi:ABC-type antimicrobial peptide transport system permease subunit